MKIIITNNSSADEDESKNIFKERFVYLFIKYKVGTFF